MGMVTPRRKMCKFESVKRIFLSVMIFSYACYNELNNIVVFEAKKNVTLNVTRQMYRIVERGNNSIRQIFARYNACYRIANK